MNSEQHGPCEYCGRDSKAIYDESQNMSVHVCNACLNLLKNPETALPLIRGHLSIEGRSAGPGFKRQLDKFMEMIAEWHSKN